MKVYISYKREDAQVVDRVASVVRAGGHDVLIDRDSIIPGSDFGRVIEEMIRSADVVIVLWSEAATQSSWIRAEASSAVDLGKYLGFMVGRVDLPLGFRLTHHTSLNPDGSEPQPGVILRELERFNRQSSEPRSSNRTVRQASKREQKVAPPQAVDLDIPPFLRPSPDPLESTVPTPSGIAQPASESMSAPAVAGAPGAAVVAPSVDGAERGYDVFISYSRKDEEACKLAFNLLVERGLVPWYDKDIGSGAFKTKIVTRISKAAVFVLLLSKNSVGSPNVSKELSVASGSDRLIIPISIDGISVAELNDTFRYELIELNIFAANPTVPESWTDVVKTIADSVNEVRAEAGAAVPIPLAQPAAPIAAAKPRERRPVLFAGLSFVSALLQQAAVGYAVWTNGADIRLAIAAGLISGAAIYPLAYAAALLARQAFKASVE